MAKTFEQADFEAAINAKDYIKLKNYVINSIRNNPRFTYGKSEECSEAKAAFKRLESLKDELPGLFSQYEVQAGEVEFNEAEKESWTQEYFIRQTFLLGENFCLERFNNIRKIGQYITKGNFNDPQEVVEGYENLVNNISNSTNEAKSIGTLPWLIVGLILATIVVLLVGKLTGIKWIFISGIILVVVTIATVVFKLVRR